MIGQMNLNGQDKVETAIQRIKMFEPSDGYYLAFSGGKDSVVIKALADMAGVKYDAHYNVTSRSAGADLLHPKAPSGRDMGLSNLCGRHQGYNVEPHSKEENAPYPNSKVLLRST